MDHPHVLSNNLAWYELESKYREYCVIQAEHRLESGSVTRFSEDLYEFIKNYTGDKEQLRGACCRKINMMIQNHKALKCLLPKANQKKDNSLLVAARMAFACRLPCSAIVAQLINRIYGLEGELRTLLLGAFFSPGNCLKLGTESLFGDLDESLEAAKYFLYHATKMKMVFHGMKSMPNVHLRVHDLIAPLNLAIVVHNTKMFQLLLEYGGDLNDRSSVITARALLILLRYVPLFSSEVPSASERIEFWKIARRAAPIKTAKEFPTLLTLAKIAFRNLLIKDMVPIEDLRLPVKLKGYLQLKHDKI